MPNHPSEGHITCIRQPGLILAATCAATLGLIICWGISSATLNSLHITGSSTLTGSVVAPAMLKKSSVTHSRHQTRPFSGPNRLRESDMYITAMPNPAQSNQSSPTLLTLGLWTSICFGLMAALWKRNAAQKPLEEVALLSVTSESTTTTGEWLDSALAAAPSETADDLSEARASAAKTLIAMGVPSARQEDWRFTDLAALRKCRYIMPSRQTELPTLPLHTCEAADKSRLVMLDGNLRTVDVSGLPSSVYVGSISSAPATFLQGPYIPLTQSSGHFFGNLNMAVCPEVICILVPAGVEVAQPLHLVYANTGGPDDRCPVAAPRVLVVLGSGAKLSIIEEFVGVVGHDGYALSIPVIEIQLAEKADLSHTVIQDQMEGAMHVKTTVIQQAATASYREVEVNIGGSLARHDMRIEQQGPATATELQCFSLVGRGQCHDLHSRVLLDHENAAVDQLHKQIAAHPSAKGIFDGNVRVGKGAQKTDAGQLTRSLLLRRGATVNVKPNLQIIADDVKCSHGCTVADLDAEEVFYLRSRGLTEQQAREALVFSFGCEVLDKVPWADVTKRVAGRVRERLAEAAASA